jgi:hypothetical protein
MSIDLKHGARRSLLNPRMTQINANKDGTNFGRLLETGTRTHSEDGTHKDKNGIFRCLFLIIRVDSRN